jgi:NAD(P)-dependent dehydrogenase (short-subunit alcohol dehydrogenase family)
LNESDKTAMELHGMPTMMVGGASGICRASAQRIVAGGGTVAIVDREESAGAEVAAELGGSWHLVNVLDYEGTELVINEVVETLGCLDALVNRPELTRRLPSRG